MRWRPAIWALAGVGVAVGGWWLFQLGTGDDSSYREAALLTGVLVAFLLPACVGSWRRPDDRVPTALAAAGFAVSIGSFRLLPQPWPAAVGALVWLATPLVVVRALVELRLAPTPRRWPDLAAIPLAAAIVVTSSARSVAGSMAGRRPASWSYEIEEMSKQVRQANPLGWWADDTAVVALWAAWSVVVVVGAVRLLRTDSLHRRRGWVIAIAIASVGANIWLAVPDRLSASVVHGRWYGNLLLMAPAIAAAVVAALAVRAEVVQPRLTRSIDGTLHLADGAAPESLRDDVQRSLGDPTARLLFRDGDGWLDGHGRRAELAAAPGRAATVVARHGSPIAALDHDVSLLTQPDLVDVTATAVALRLEAARLAAVAEAGAEDVRASAARLLAAADRGRREVEERIMAGPDRLLAELLPSLDERPLPLEHIHGALRDALGQVRTIAHGVSPPVLHHNGIVAALEQWHDDGGPAVAVVGLGDERLPAPVELTVYLVIAAATGRNIVPAASVVRTTDGVDVWVAPVHDALEPLLLDRIDTLNGRVEEHGDGIVVHLPASER